MAVKIIATVTVIWILKFIKSWDRSSKHGMRSFKSRSPYSHSWLGFVVHAGVRHPETSPMHYSGSRQHRRRRAASDSEQLTGREATPTGYKWPVVTCSESATATSAQNWSSTRRLVQPMAVSTTVFVGRKMLTSRWTTTSHNDPSWLVR